MLSLSEIFAWVTAIEYAYEQAPKDMKTVVQAISLLIAGMGSAVAMTLTTVSHDPNMVIFYASLAGAMAATGVVFYYIFRKMVDLPTSERISIIGNSMPIQEMGNEGLSDAATRQLHLSLEPSSYAAHTGSSPPNTTDNVSKHVRIIEPKSSAKRSDSSPPSDKRAQHLHTPTPMPLRSASPPHSLRAGEPDYTHSDEITTRTPSTCSSKKSCSSGYDTADEYAPRCPSPAKIAPIRSPNSITAPPESSSG